MPAPQAEWAATIAAVLAAQGADVVLADLPAAQTREVAAEIRGVRTLTVDLDVGSPDSVEQAFGTIAEQWGPLDILVNNVGIGQARSQMDESDWDATFQVNLMGTVRCTEAVPACDAGTSKRQSGEHRIHRRPLRTGDERRLQRQQGRRAPLHKGACGRGCAVVDHRQRRMPRQPSGQGCS